MRINGSLNGDFGFRAIYDYHGMWEITEGVFFTKEEVAQYFANKVPAKYLWPVEVEPNGQIVYVPEENEL